MPAIDLTELVAVKRKDEYAYLGWCLAGARGRVFGGQVAAQALYAAGCSAPRDRRPQSLHAHFLRPGDPDLPISYGSEVVKDGRAFSTYLVRATQREQLVLTAIASFHLTEPSPRYHLPMPDVPEPGRCQADPSSPPGSNPAIRRPLEFRRVALDAEVDQPAPAEQRVWWRARRLLSGRTLDHVCALVYATDTTLPRTARRSVRGPGVRLLGSSLEHTVWFHDAFRVDDWLLFEQHTASYAHGRTLSHGRLFTADGRLVASASQEGLLREG